MFASLLSGQIPLPPTVGTASWSDALLAVATIAVVAVALTVALVVAGRPAKKAPIIKQLPVDQYRKAA